MPRKARTDIEVNLRRTRDRTKPPEAAAPYFRKFCGRNILKVNPEIRVLAGIQHTKTSTKIPKFT